MIELVRVTPDMLNQVWPHITRHMARIVDTARATHDEASYRALCERDLLQLWIAFEPPARIHAVALTELKQYPRAKVCEAVGIAGDDRHKWLPLLPHFEAWAKAQGCVAFRVSRGRKGWAREHAFRDYRMTINLERVLT